MYGIRKIPKFNVLTFIEYFPSVNFFRTNENV